MARKKYRAKNVIDYISTDTGRETRVVPGDEFDDMSSLSVKNELSHGNIEEVK
jgi:hypothetical protein